jgi:hypothetical protein
MPAFKAPQYTKVVNPKTGLQEPCYTFNINFNDSNSDISFVAENQSDIITIITKMCFDNLEWWNNFIQQFLQSSV